MTLLLAAMSLQGPVLLADGLTTNLPHGPAMTTVKMANLPAGSNVVVMTAGRATFRGVPAIEECRNAIEDARLTPSSAESVRDLLRLHLCSWDTTGATPTGITIVCVEPARTIPSMVVAVSRINFRDQVATRPHTTTQVWLSEGDAAGQEYALAHLERLGGQGVPNGVALRDPLADAFTALSQRDAVEVAAALQGAVQAASDEQRSRGEEVTVGGATAAMLLSTQGPPSILF